ncbi:PASTA domain-containing protein [Friedmanniella luteola]|nr:PASTA domain-containing protein [Friedmanniella luteola]
MKDLRPPQDVVTCLHAGDLVIISALNDEELGDAGLSAEIVRSAINGAPFCRPRSRAALAEIWTTSRSGDTAWISLMQPLLPHDPYWRSIVGAHWALYNAYFNEQYLDTGKVGTRANTLLEITDAGATVSDHQVLFTELAESIAAGKLSAFQHGAIFGSMLVAGGVVGFFTAGAGASLVGRAGGWVEGSLENVDDWVSELALRYLLASIIEEHDRKRHLGVAKTIHEEAQAIGRSDPNPRGSKQFRMLMGAYAKMLEGMAPDTADTTQTIPDVVGLRLGDAKAMLRTAGFVTIVQFDAAPPAEGPRSAWSESRWNVRGQWPSPGVACDPSSTIRLAYSRPEERVRQQDMDRRLREGN